MFFTGNEITKAGLIATHIRDWTFSAIGYLYEDTLENWDSIPAAK